jgi:uncharacterized protein with HEPN domain
MREARHKDGRGTFYDACAMLSRSLCEHPEVKKRLQHALKACQGIDEFTNGVTFDEYESDRMLRSAVMRQLDVAGIAMNMARRKDPTITSQLPNMRQITRIRHQVIHRYYRVNNAEVWEVVQTGVPAIEGQIFALLSDHDEGN